MYSNATIESYEENGVVVFVAREIGKDGKENKIKVPVVPDYARGFAKRANYLAKIADAKMLGEAS